MMAPVKIPSREGRCEKIEGAPGTCPPSNEGGLQGGHWKSAPSLDSTVDTPLKSPLGQGGTSPRTTSFCKDSRILSHLQGVGGEAAGPYCSARKRHPLAAGPQPLSPLQKGDYFHALLYVHCLC